jgi:hypothetical protein
MDWLLIPGWEDNAPSADDSERRTARCLSQALDRLQAEVGAFDDRLEVRGLLKLDIPSREDCQPSGTAALHPRAP